MRILPALLLVLPLLSGCFGDAKTDINLPPVAGFVIERTDAPTRFVLDASTSRDPEGQTLSYGWNWVLGGQETTEPRLTLDLPAAAVAGNARYFVTLIVRDAHGAADYALEALDSGSGENQPPEIRLAEGTRWLPPGSEVVLDASTSLDPEGDPLVAEWVWGPRAGFQEHPEPVDDPCATADPRPATFSTGCLGPGESIDHTFDTAGTFDLHCHPHPWMKSRLVVDPAQAAAAEPVELDIANFALASLTVGAGTTIRFVNRDPVPHTATVEAWTPGTTSGGSDLVLRLSPPAGDYVARLTLTDAKGNRATQTWGIRLSDDAPRIETGNFSGLVRVRNQESVSAPNLAIQANWTGRVEATLNWTDPSQAVKGNMSIGAGKDDDWDELLGSCAARPAAQGQGVVLSCLVSKGDYAFRARADEGAFADGLLEWRILPLEPPGFGDSVAGHHH